MSPAEPQLSGDLSSVGPEWQWGRIEAGRIPHSLSFASGFRCIAFPLLPRGAGRAVEVWAALLPRLLDP
jgi:hypothetical protein